MCGVANENGSPASSDQIERSFCRFKAPKFIYSHFDMTHGAATFAALFDNLLVRHTHTRTRARVPPTPPQGAQKFMCMCTRSWYACCELHHTAPTEDPHGVDGHMRLTSVNRSTRNRGLPTTHHARTLSTHTTAIALTFACKCANGTRIADQVKHLTHMMQQENTASSAGVPHMPRV